MSEAPAHYLSASPDSDLECITAMKAFLTPEELRGYKKGNAFKYLWRADRKDGDKDYDKLTVYVGWLKSPKSVLATLTAESQRLGLYDTQAPELSPEVEARAYADSDDNVGDLKAGEAHG